VPDVFVVTGGAGFIGSHIVERLLAEPTGASVRVFDDFSTGALTNLPFAAAAGPRLEVIRGDIRDLAALEQAATGASVIFHQAALRSVPLSVEDPLGTNDRNVTGNLNVLEAARRRQVRRVVYASSSSVYGAGLELPKREAQPPAPLSPYAVSKAVGEQYAGVWTRLYGVETLGLRYFQRLRPPARPRLGVRGGDPAVHPLGTAGRAARDRGPAGAPAHGGMRRQRAALARRHRQGQAGAGLHAARRLRRGLRRAVDFFR